MKENLSLIVLGGYALVLLVAGFVWKEIRDYRDSRKQRSLPLQRNRRKEDRNRKTDGDLVSAAHG